MLFFLGFGLSPGHVLLQDGDDEVVLGDEAVLGDEDGEPPAEAGLGLELVEDLPVVEVGVREDAVDAPADGAQLGHRALLDGDAAGEVLVAV